MHANTHLGRDLCVVSGGAVIFTDMTLMNAGLKHTFYGDKCVCLQSLMTAFGLHVVVFICWNCSSLRVVFAKASALKFYHHIFFCFVFSYWSCSCVFTFNSVSHPLSVSLPPDCTTKNQSSAEQAVDFTRWLNYILPRAPETNNNSLTWRPYDFGFAVCLR